MVAVELENRGDSESKGKGDGKIPRGRSLYSNTQPLDHSTANGSPKPDGMVLPRPVYQHGGLCPLAGYAVVPQVLRAQK